MLRKTISVLLALAMVSALRLRAVFRPFAPFIVPPWIGYNVLDSPMRDE